MGGDINKVIEELDKFSENGYADIQSQLSYFKNDNVGLCDDEIFFWGEKDINLESDSDILIDFLTRLSYNDEMTIECGKILEKVSKKVRV